MGGLLFAATLLVYAQVWEFGFVTVDDSAYVPGNPYVLQGLTPQSVIWSWTAVHDSNWIPFTWLSLMLDTNLYHGRPGGYHVTNALMHAVSAVLLFVALLMATGARGKSAVVAALSRCIRCTSNRWPGWPSGRTCSVRSSGVSRSRRMCGTRGEAAGDGWRHRLGLWSAACSRSRRW